MIGPFSALEHTFPGMWLPDEVVDHGYVIRLAPCAISVVATVRSCLPQAHGTDAAMRLVHPAMRLKRYLITSPRGQRQARITAHAFRVIG